MKPRTEWGKKLQRFNLGMGLIHSVQAFVMLAFVNSDLTLPILTRFFDQTNDGIRPVTETLWNVPVVYAAPLFLGLSALAHFIIASPLYVKRYEDNLKKGINEARWWEYSLSSSIMLTVLLMLGGLLELPSVVFIFTLNVIMNLMGLVMERLNQYTKKTEWLPYNIGVLAGLVPWIIGALYFYVSTSNIADSIPNYAKIGFLTTFLFFNSFAVNMYLQYKKIGPWKDYLFGERMYIWLSLIAKSVLGWILVLGTMGVSGR